MTITLPDEVRAQAERQAKAAGFASVGEYLVDLVQKDVEVGPPTDPLSGYTYEELGQLLDAAKDGPWLPWTRRSGRSGTASWLSSWPRGGFHGEHRLSPAGDGSH